MFKKILIAEDFESYNLAVQKVVEELSIPEIQYVHYCDDAISRLETAVREGQSFDLLITDLSFVPDYRIQDVNSGQGLIKKAKQLCQDLKIIVFSIENKPQTIEEVVNKLQINGFVSKGREDSKELKKAITAVFNNQTYLSSDAKKSLSEINSYEISDYDVELLKYLSEGLSQKSISQTLSEKGIAPSSISTIEKRLYNLRETLSATNNHQLVATCKDLGII